MTDAPEGHAPHVDSHTGIATTGHEWDGISELNRPLPRWWLWTFYITIAFSIAYWVVYPSWPLVTGHIKGAFGWSSRTQVLGELESLQQLRGAMVAKLTETPLDEIQSDPQLFDFTFSFGEAAFGDNCAPCHGAGGAGAVGYANLRDDDWLWGGSIDQIHQTIYYGVRNDNPDSHTGDMLAFGRDGILANQEILDVAAYVRSLSGLDHPAGADPQAGATVFADNCASCHGDNATGDQELGSANLTDPIWLYGGDYDTIVQTVRNGRAGSMPAWGPRLGDTTVKALTVYVNARAGGQ